MAEKYVSSGNLGRAVTKLRDDAAGKYVAKEEGKGLSTNDLTDELVEKINNAGDSTFTGAYADLTGKPSIGGKEIATGDQTAESLGLETPAGSKAKADAARTGAVEDVKKLGYQTAADVTAAVAAGTAGMVTESALTAKGYDTASSVDSKVSAAKTEATAAVNAAKTELTAKIDAAVSAVYKPKGSAAFADLPEFTAAKAGDVYNVTDAFTTTSDFVEGAGKGYPAGTNVVCVSVTTGEGDEAATALKWDALPGFVDLSGYMGKADMAPMTDAEIDALFA